MSDPARDLGPRFVDVARIAEGAEGGTWAACDADAGGRRVVLKRVPPERAPQVRQAFRVLRRVRSPYLPAALELLRAEDGAVWLVTAYIEGAPLVPGPAPLPVVLAEAIAVAHALRAIHEAGTHHGDVSPANVLACAGTAVLTDFGQIGCLGCGTPGFLAPEALAGGGGPAADVFALGSLICFRLFGAPPWTRPEALVDAQRRGERAVEERLAELARRTGYGHGAEMSGGTDDRDGAEVSHRTDDGRGSEVSHGTGAGGSAHGALSGLIALLQRMLALDPGRRLVDLGLVLARLQALASAAEAGQGGADLSGKAGPTWWLPARWPYAGTSLAPALAVLLPVPRARLVAVAGPPGAGRGRVVEEIVAALQAQAEGPVARLCPAERIGAALSVEAAGWIEAWMSGAGAGTVLGLPDPPPWAGELSDETGDEEPVARRRAAVLAAAAATAGATLIVPVSPALGAALARAGAGAAARGEAPIAVVEVRPWEEGELAAALVGVLDPPEERDGWARALHAATGGWPGATIEAIEACARAKIHRPDAGAIAAAASSSRGALDPGRALLVLEAAWSAEGQAVAAAAGTRLGAGHLFAPGGAPLGWAVEAARRTFGARLGELARERLAELDAEEEVRLALAVDAGDAEVVGRWLQRCPAAGGTWERDPALAGLVAWISAGGAVDDAGRAKIAGALLRAGQAHRARELAEDGGPRCALVVARALEQTGRAGEALVRLDRLIAALADPMKSSSGHVVLSMSDRTYALDDAAALDLLAAAVGLRWRALTDLGRPGEAVAAAVRLTEAIDARGAGDGRPAGIVNLSEGSCPQGAGDERPAPSVHMTEETGLDEAGDGRSAGVENLTEGTGARDPADWRLAAALGRPGPGSAEAWLWAGLAAIYGGAEGRADGWLDRAEARLGGPEAWPGLQARIDQVRGNLAHVRGQIGAAQAAYERAAAGFERAGEGTGRALLSANLAALSILSGEIGRGLEHGRRALRAYLQLGRVQALPELVENLVQLLVRVGAQAEAERAHVLLAQTLGTDAGPLSRARLERVRAELVWGERLAGTAGDAAVAHAFAAAAAALRAAGAGRDAAEASLRAAAAARRCGQPARAGELLAAAEQEAGDDAELRVGIALERALLASAGGSRGGLAAACEALAGLPRPAELLARGRLDLAWHYDHVLYAILAADDPRRPALARRAAATWEALMSKIPELDRPAARAALIAEAGERAAVAALVGDLPESAGEAEAATTSERRAPSENARGAEAAQLLRIYRRLAREDDLDRLLAQVVDAAMELCDAERGAVALLAPETGGARGKKPRLLARELAGEAGGAFSRSVLERVIAEGTSILSVDAVTDDRFGQSRSVSHLNLRSVLAVPLYHRGRLLGALYVDHRLRRGAWGEADLARLEEFAELAALAIAHLGTVEALAERGRELSALLEARELEVRGLREAARTPERRSYRGMVGGTAAMQAVFRLVDRLADSDVPVVIYGESGTGKELVARAIHDGGPRRARPFVAENCGAIPETLLESVLFGHAKGAFTGAQRATPGLFEAADGGTLFLDEIGEMSPAMQTKLLRVLQEGEVRRVGDTAVRKVDVRVIAASNRDLDAMAAAGQFRQDLLYRIRVVKVELPPLRARTEDLPLLIEHFLGKYDRARRLTVTAAAVRALARYAWPGNIRELENEVQRWVALCESRVEVDDLSPAIRAAPGGKAPADDDLRLRPRVDRLERELIERALRVAGGNQTRAAALLGLSRFGLQKKLRRIEIGGDEDD